MEQLDYGIRPEGLDWRKSSRSGPYSDNCVEVALAGGEDSTGQVFVRDSKDPEGSWLNFGPNAWASFVGYVAAAELHPPTS